MDPEPASSEGEIDPEEAKKIKEIFGDDWFGKPGVSSCSSQTEDDSEEEKAVFKKADHVTFDEGTGKYTCSVCSRTFKAKKQARYHLFCGKEEKPFKCKLCSKRFVTRSHFTYHMRTHSGEKPFGCSFCDRHFYQKDKAKRHEKSHSQQENVECETCGKQIKVNSLPRHKATHTIRHACTKCPRTYADVTSLRRHALKHAGTKFMCDRCGKEFGRQSALTVHTRIHFGERHFACNKCDKAFKNKKELTRHKHIHAEDVSFSCGFCEVSFRRKDNLRRHLRNTHPESQKASVIVTPKPAQQPAPDPAPASEPLSEHNPEPAQENVHSQQPSVIQHTNTFERESVIKSRA